MAVRRHSTSHGEQTDELALGRPQQRYAPQEVAHPSPAILGRRQIVRACIGTRGVERRAKMAQERRPSTLRRTSKQLPRSIVESHLNTERVARLAVHSLKHPPGYPPWEHAPRGENRRLSCPYPANNFRHPACSGRWIGPTPKCLVPRAVSFSMHAPRGLRSSSPLK